MQAHAFQAISDEMAKRADTATIRDVLAIGTTMEPEFVVPPMIEHVGEVAPRPANVVWADSAVIAVPHCPAYIVVDAVRMVAEHFSVAHPLGQSTQL